MLNNLLRCLDDLFVPPFYFGWFSFFVDTVACFSISVQLRSAVIHLLRL